MGARQGHEFAVVTFSDAQRQELIRGAREDIAANSAKLDWYKKHGHYTAEDANRFTSYIAHQEERLKQL